MSGETPKIAVDLDGTLAEYHGWVSSKHIGAPVPLMVKRVRKMLHAGEEVVIFTARANWPESIAPVQEWCETNLGLALPVTAQKTPDIVEFWDDRAVAVEMNTGRIVRRARAGYDWYDEAWETKGREDV